MNHRIDILLSTFNGANYLREQLDSLLAQSFRDWRIIIRDDGSSDGTLEIVEKYQTRHPGIIEILPTQGNLGYFGSFMKLLSHSTAPYVMFCDQDDIWMKEKISISFSVIQHCEAQWPGVPILVHTDLTVVDSRLGLISMSKWRDLRWFPDTYVRDSKSLMVVPLVSGNTCIFNSRAREASLEKVEAIYSHDWWVALRTMVSGGRIVNLPFSTILYRRHQKVASGASRLVGGGYALRALLKPRRIVGAMKREIHAARKAGITVSWAEFLIRKGRYLCARYFYY
jgi:glycosyltransferase involved in cell wall biosynthesis